MMRESYYQEFAINSKPWLIVGLIIMIILLIALVILSGYRRKKAGKKPLTSKRTKIVILTVVLVGWFMFDISGIGGNIRFYGKWAECNTKPIVTRGSGIMNAYGPEYYEAPTFSLIRLSPEYYCSEEEAKKAGFYPE